MEPDKIARQVESLALKAIELATRSELHIAGATDFIGNKLIIAVATVRAHGPATVRWYADGDVFARSDV